VSRPKHLDVPVGHFSFGGLCRRYIDEYDLYYSDQITEAHHRITRAFYAMIIEEHRVENVSSSHS